MSMTSTQRCVTVKYFCAFSVNMLEYLFVFGSLVKVYFVVLVSGHWSFSFDFYRYSQSVRRYAGGRSITHWYNVGEGYSSNDLSSGSVSSSLTNVHSGASANPSAASEPDLSPNSFLGVATYCTTPSVRLFAGGGLLDRDVGHGNVPVIHEDDFSPIGRGMQFLCH